MRLMNTSSCREKTLARNPRNSKKRARAALILLFEATGSGKIPEDAINYVRRGGKLVVYGVYSNKDRVSWPRTKICKPNCPPDSSVTKIFSRIRIELTAFVKSATRSPSWVSFPEPTNSLLQSAILTAERSRSWAL